MPLHFSRDEFAARRRRACDEMAKAGLDGLLIFRQESMYWLTGYDTSGYSMFQGMYLRADGALALLTRSADLRQARLTSVIEDIRIWTDREGADPAGELRDMVADYGGRGRRIGVEYHAYGLTAQRGKTVDAAFAGFCELVDASDLVRLLRLVKSPAELAYLRQAGRLVDEACAVSRRLTVPGASVGAVYGEMINTIMRGDGDPNGSSDPQATLGHARRAAEDRQTQPFEAPVVLPTASGSHRPSSYDINRVPAALFEFIKIVPAADFRRCSRRQAPAENGLAGGGNRFRTIGPAS